MLTIFIDESGTLPDPRDRFIVICGVGVKKIKEAENIFSRIRISCFKIKNSLEPVPAPIQVNLLSLYQTKKARQ